MNQKSESLIVTSEDCIKVFRPVTVAFYGFCVHYGITKVIIRKEKDYNPLLMQSVDDQTVT